MCQTWPVSCSPCSPASPPSRPHTLCPTTTMPGEVGPHKQPNTYKHLAENAVKGRVKYIKPINIENKKHFLLFNYFKTHFWTTENPFSLASLKIRFECHLWMMTWLLDLQCAMNHCYMFVCMSQSRNLICCQNFSVPNYSFCHKRSFLTYMVNFSQTGPIKALLNPSIRCPFVRSPQTFLSFSSLDESYNNVYIFNENSS